VSETQGSPRGRRRDRIRRDEGEEQPGRGSRRFKGPGGERRPRRRGRRGVAVGAAAGRMVWPGSIADELGPTPVSEATDAVCHFDEIRGEPSLLVVYQPESMQPFGPNDNTRNQCVSRIAEALSPPCRRTPLTRGERARASAAQPVACEKVRLLESKARPDPAPAPVQS